MINTTIKLIKNNAKSNVTCSISRDENHRFVSMNFTGKLTSCEGFNSSEGINYDAELISIDCPTTVIITNEAQANAVYERLGNIFADRLQAGDKNPAVDLKILSNSIRPTNTNILITNVEKVFVNSNTSLANTNARINDSLEALRKFSAVKSTITSATPNAQSNRNNGNNGNNGNNAQVLASSTRSVASTNPQVLAAKTGLDSLISSVKKSIKTYL